MGIEICSSIIIMTPERTVEVDKNMARNERMSMQFTLRLLLFYQIQDRLVVYKSDVFILNLLRLVQLLLQFESVLV